MKITRRTFVELGLGAACANVLGQGVASRGVKPQPRGKASGLPFRARFSDIGQAAGLKQKTIYGEPDRKEYILETIGCGCAFIDYDNDGWLDIFLLCGTKVGIAPADATNRLYKNNRDGTFTDVTPRLVFGPPVGPREFVSVTTTMTDLKICFSHSGARTSCFETTETAPSPM